MNLFYEPELTADTTLLNGTESHHCIKVLRMKEGAELYITNGQGMLCSATLRKGDPKGCLVEITGIQHDYGKRPFRLHIAIAPTKSIDRFEWFLEKAVECGIDVITPLLCDHSERKILKPARLEKLLIAAMKQSGRAYLPVLNPLIEFPGFVINTDEAKRLIAHCSKGENNPLNKSYTAGNDVVLVIGPEGDFSEDELSMAESNGFNAISMGGFRLRTETAGIVACVQINGINGML